MSLEDCIEVALHHNLDLQIKRLNPELSRFTLDAAYGAYDPSLYGSAEHDYRRQPGSVDSNGRLIPGAELETDSFTSGFQGLLPWGLAYNLGISMADQTTVRPGTPASTATFTNTFFDVTSGNNITLISTNNQPAIPTISAETFSGQAGFLQLRQPLLKNFWIDSTRLQIILDKKNLKISELDLRSQVMTTVTAVEQAYYNLIFSQENIKVQQKALELAERQLAENKKRVEVGAMAPLDEKQAQSQVAGSRADLLNALGTEETQQRVVKSLLSDDYSKWAKVAIKPTQSLIALPEKFNLQESWRKGLSQRPDLLQEKLSLSKQGDIIRLQKNQLYPQLDVVGTAGYNASSATFGGYLDQFGGRDNPFYSVGGQLTIPLGNNTARNNYKSAKATQDQIAMQLKQLEQNVLIQIENDIAVANTRFQQVDATREARIYAEAALDAEQKKLESGKSTSFVVLQLTKDLTTARSTEISALASYNNALAQLALDEGDTLERRHVSLEIK
jgi:outer membrane protein TolC